MPLDRAKLLRRLRFGVLSIGALVWFGTIMSSFSFFGDVAAFRARKDYVSAVFVVTDTFNSPSKYAQLSGNAGGETYFIVGQCYLIGDIDGHRERLTPEVLVQHNVECSKLQEPGRYPVGTPIPVWFNPNAQDIDIQGKSLRVIERTKSLDALSDSIRDYVVFGLIPSLLLLLALVVVRRSERSWHVGA